MYNLKLIFPLSTFVTTSGAKSTMLAAKSTDRRETFMKQKVTIREKAIATSRRSGPFSTNSAGKQADKEMLPIIIDLFVTKYHSQTY